MRTVFVICLVAVVGGIGFVFYKLESSLPNISYNEFLATLENGEVAEVHIKGGEITLTDTAGRKSATFSPDIAVLTPKLAAKNVAIYGESDQSSHFWDFLTLTMPIGLILVAWFFLMRRQMKSEESSEFAKGKDVSFSKTGKRVTFLDVSGIPEAKGELLEIVDFLQKPTKYSKLGAIIPKGVLFQGPPGTGKTLLARAVAGEADVPFFSISGSDFVEMFVGVGASRVRDLFKEAKKHTPCIIFIDEIDAVGGLRGSSGAAGGQDERGQTLNALLVEMDGFGSDDNIIVIAATNRPDILDPALLRPGRFDRMISVLPPDVKGRREILEVHVKKVKVSESVDLDEVARSTPGFTGAELASLVNESALIAGRTNKKAIDMRDFEAAKDRILMGVERKGLVISEKDRRTMACHEAGHAIVARFLPGTDPLHKITIIPRGRAMGQTQQMPLQDRHAYSKDYLKNRISILMGGRAAEQVFLHQQTTGAEGDLAQALEIATNMVCRWGMNDLIGPMAYVQSDGGFLGGHSSFKNYSEGTACLIDSEIKKLVENCYQEALQILEKHQGFIHQLAETLLEAETLDREEMEIIFECSLKKENEASGAAGSGVCFNNPDS
ncbi:MAG: ATP-dependent zinc metalloprotease FtsH [Proteobacteria bacterium]|nr:ATP-dependent zinc metalloprotease FtsH [Pseudomonadota bacterium]MBU1717018.1 ATP-dependent zinc metalloprotease FtsH [Pseudomonadota bacterium]